LWPIALRQGLLEEQLQGVASFHFLRQVQILLWLIWFLQTPLTRKACEKPKKRCLLGFY
jgi:hypothetical protein